MEATAAQALGTATKATTAAAPLPLLGRALEALLPDLARLALLLQTRGRQLASIAGTMLHNRRPIPRI